MSEIRLIMIAVPAPVSKVAVTGTQRLHRAERDSIAAIPRVE
jgi:hypothetical protein